MLALLQQANGNLRIAQLFTVSLQGIYASHQVPYEEATSVFISLIMVQTKISQFN